MSDTYSIHWLGWNNQGSHDKIWGFLETNNGKFLAFWGRRGKALQFKAHPNKYAALKVARTKEATKGYDLVDPSQYDNLTADFRQELELHCMTAILSETIR